MLVVVLVVVLVVRHGRLNLLVLQIRLNLLVLQTPQILQVLHFPRVPLALLAMTNYFYVVAGPHHLLVGGHLHHLAVYHCSGVVVYLPLGQVGKVGNHSDHWVGDLSGEGHWGVGVLGVHQTEILSRHLWLCRE